ncbi:family 10 glycosylhydrolase [Streptomyces sp. DSM 44915]|uniref:Family 10 glycosylhydrolase n=1 Tax=Streptomyces chisholmiae TaxID=3075540 RepID=A0ABU2JYN5_9ACTN|nr:family 10 glycosylhydrolase [Streptomyces sp. DSM 44915]MDT0269318.1 family 10 glycosylhydrolase [Streptomyces sp. DSM 44915]
MRRTLLTLLACLSLLLGALATVTPAQADEPETSQWRGYWVDAFNAGIYTPQQVTTLIEDAQAVNANALIVQTGRRYDCFCNRALYPRTDAAIDPAPYDPLDEVIRQAHAADLEVHAWVNVNTLWNSATPPTSPEHAFNQHGPTAEGYDRWLNRKADGTEFVGANAYIDPGHPAAVDYIESAIRSIVREYDVDGVNLDYIRYPDGSSATTHSDWGYNEVSVARFQAATGRDDVPEPADGQWSDWRRDQVTNLVRRLYLGIWEEDPRARLSINAITYANGPQAVGGFEQTRTYREVLQDWAGWLDEGIVDTVVAMNYKRDWQPEQRQMFAEWTEFLADAQGDRQAVNGPALYLNSIADSLRQAQLSLAPTAAGNTAAGWSGYSYATPSLDVPGTPATEERAALVEALTTGPDAPFAEPAAVPEMTWKTAPDDGHLTGELTLRDGTPLDGAEVTLLPLGAGERRTAVADGSGWFGFAHLPAGHYLVRVSLPHGVVGVPLLPARIGAGSLTEVDFPPYLALPGH